MPTYDYACAGCGGFDAFRSLHERNDPARCPACGASAPRVFASAPRLAVLSGDARRAHETNERAAHAPQGSSGYARLRHPAGCGCCAATKRSGAAQAPDGARSFPTRRPWMISH
ncbi:MAG TPA: zinc ribbon domain-containing protein [Albitalea sp.]|jgi:putative FmdB family regulatory protein|nr:zinc ribbon domain-containing protein [Albitalea sp.]